MSKEEKAWNDLLRLIKEKDFKSEDELKAFMNSIMGKPIPEKPKENLTEKERAEDLVYEAREMHPAEGRKNAEEALKLDPDCILAYEYLADTEISKLN